ncbi:MAG TPA: cupin domain-containing protein, partial [Acetobacteraceae bacterium]
MRIAVAALAAVLAPIALAQPAGAQQAGAQPQHMEMYTTPGALKWGPAPPSLPKGAQLAVLFGNPGGTGLFAVRLMMPAGYQVPAHHHPTTENVTILSGRFNAGMGDKLDMAKGQVFEPGGFVSMPAQM